MNDAVETPELGFDDVRDVLIFAPPGRTEIQRKYGRLWEPHAGDFVIDVIEQR
jgi:hypothetical protein